MGKTTFSGPVRSIAGFSPDGWGNIVTHPHTETTLALTAAEHGGRWISLTGDHSLVATLPEINAMDPGDPTAPGQGCNFGLTFRMIISNTITSLTLQTATGDEFFGGLTISTESNTTEAGGATLFALDGDGYNTLTINSALTGFMPGGILEVFATPAATAEQHRWNVSKSHLLGVGDVSTATPFSAV